MASIYFMNIWNTIILIRYEIEKENHIWFGIMNIYNYKLYLVQVHTYYIQVFLKYIIQNSMKNWIMKIYRYFSSHIVSSIYIIYELWFLIIWWLVLFSYGVYFNFYLSIYIHCCVLKKLHCFVNILLLYIFNSLLLFYFCSSYLSFLIFIVTC